jgi:hypothetical protein
MIAPLLLGITAALGGQVVLRAGADLPSADVISITAPGMVVGDEGRPEWIIGWDRVLRVDDPHAAEAALFLRIGEELWRARTRLERGDAPSAEPIFERLLPELSPGGGPMLAVAAEGLLRCRLRRGAQVAAVEPWIEWLRVRDLGSADGPAPFAPDWSARSGMEPIIDSATGLVPGMPPVWLDWSPVRVYAGTEPPASEGPPTKAATLAALYLHAARFEVGLEASLPVISRPDDPGISLVLDMVLARSGGAEVRAGAREALTKRLSGERDTWTEAWCRAAIGRSMIRESDEEDRRLGVVELLHLPARFSRSHPYLAGLCLAEASAALADLGDSAGAAALRKDLFDLFPDHPVLSWERVRLAGSAIPNGSGPSRAPSVIPLSTTEYP